MTAIDPIESARRMLSEYAGPPLRIMEVCGTHTHEIFRLGIRNLLPPSITLLSGPGCPVCVTPISYIDEALYLTLEKGCLLATFGDLLKVPGTHTSLARARQDGANVRMVYSPLDALSLAKENPSKEVVFLSVGFETTVPGACLALDQALKEGVPNFSLLVANKTMPNAYTTLKESAQAYLYPGHVHAIIGTEICQKLTDEGISGVVAGFTASELLTALATIAIKSQQAKPFFVNCYGRVVRKEGNPKALELIAKYMEPCATEWRGLGVLAESGLMLKNEYAAFDAKKRFAIPDLESHAPRGCRCGEILKGECLPRDCPLFGKRCTPSHPIGACMVSSEGTCAAYYHYGDPTHGK